MKRYFTLLGLVITLLILLFYIVEYFQLPFLTDPTAWFKQKTPLTASLGVLLLTVDVIIPVPSSIIMTANGAFFGVALGSLLSLLGGLGSALIGFTLGRRCSSLVRRIVSETEWAKAQLLLSRWGTLAVIVTRPIPILAETMAMLAGTSSISCCRMAIASALGLLPPILLYSFSGAMATGLGSPLIAFLTSMAVATAFWWFGRRNFRQNPKLNYKERK